MFTAIVTAMLGLIVASSLGLASLRDISESIASLTWIWPMLVGGFVLGAGFIISGYCPGTSIVAGASGNIDGVVTVAGVVTGTFVYSELLQIPAFLQFHNSGAKGAWFLYDIIKTPPQVLAAVVAVAAILAFIGAERVESMMGGVRTATRIRRYAFGSVTALATVALVSIAFEATPAAANQPAPPIRAADLAQMIVDAPWTVRILDVRDAAAFAKERVPGSQNVPASSLADVTSDGRVIVIVGDAKVLPFGARVLNGGMNAWKSEPLVVATTSGAPPPPPPAATGAVISKPKKKGGGCSA